MGPGQTKTMNKKGLAIGLAGVLLGLSIVGIIIIVTIYVIASNVGNMRAIVIDAGSSSSKLTLYKWKDDPFRTNGRLEEVNKDTVAPGISAYMNKPGDAFTKMQPNLLGLVSNVPVSEQNKMPIYLAATAGMRLALLQDPLGSFTLFDHLRRGLETTNFQVETPNERIRLLSGEEEGNYGWVSVNALLNLITADQQVPYTETVGSLDLGGASTQITFAVNPPSGERLLPVGYTNLRLFGQTYHVFSHSYLCYGKDQAERRVQASVIALFQQGSTSAATINNPCLNLGNTVGANADEIYNSPCISGPYADKTFSENLSQPTGLKKFQFRGTGDPAACSRRIEAQFQTTCTAQPCSFNDVPRPDLTGLFRAYSGFSFVIHYLFPNKTTGLTLTEVAAAVDTFCRTPWRNLVSSADPSTHKYLTKYCFDGLYVKTLLQNYGFKTDDQWKTITFGTKVNKKSVSWAFGYMLDQSGHLPSESPKLNFPLAAFVVLLVIFIIGLIIGIVLLVLLLTGRV